MSGDETPARRPWWRPRRVGRSGLLIGVLVALLGFAIAVQLHSTGSGDSLSSARQDDLIRILDDQDARADRLRQQIAELQTLEAQLAAGGDADTVAREQAQQQVDALSVLLGIVPASGPGIVVTITDPAHGLKAEDLLDVVEELRGAGAEAIQFGPVRVGTDTALLDDGTQVLIDGVAISPPYTVLAIGDPATMSTALTIPGGVAAVARSVGGDATIVQRQTLTISAVRTLPGH